MKRLRNDYGEDDLIMALKNSQETKTTKWIFRNPCKCLLLLFFAIFVLWPSLNLTRFGYAEWRDIPKNERINEYFRFKAKALYGESLNCCAVPDEPSFWFSKNDLVLNSLLIDTFYVSVKRCFSDKMSDRTDATRLARANHYLYGQVNT